MAGSVIQVDDNEVRDQLPEDLDRGFVGVYKFPDNKRRRVTGLMYLIVALAIGIWSVGSGEPVLQRWAHSRLCRWAYSAYTASLGEFRAR